VPVLIKRLRQLKRRGVWSDRSPYAVVKESPSTGSRVPHQVSLGRPGRRRRSWRCPRRRGPPGSPARRSRTLPVVALIPVPVVVVAPGWVPLLTRAPVVAGRGSRGPLGDTAGQNQSGKSQPVTHQ
jgi:hypothetical protein